MIRSGNSDILYDAALISNPHVGLLDPHWLQQHAQLQLISHGRGEAWFVDYQQHHWVLRHYMRGGMVARFNRQTYLGWSLAKSRAWQEWHLLHQLCSQGLAVPKPVAACVSWPVSRFGGFYRAYLLTERIAGAETLSQRLQRTPLDDSVWQQIGQSLADFHLHGVYHADLNANNILFDEQDKIYLIDFDRGEIRQAGDWQGANLARLQRSLIKLQGLHGRFYYQQNDWLQLMAAYAEKNSG